MRERGMKWWVCAGISALLLLAGCAQSTLLFGSGVTVGLKVGTDAKQQPQITVGYDQVDAAVVPLAMGWHREQHRVGSFCMRASILRSQDSANGR